MVPQKAKYLRIWIARMVVIYINVLCNVHMGVRNGYGLIKTFRATIEPRVLTD